MNNLLSAALDYAARGWRVHPLYSRRSDGGCTCGKPNCDKVAKHPRTKWGESASTDATEIKRWWEKWPDANIGLVTGAKSGIVVLDVDEKDGRRGKLTLSKLQTQHNWHPVTWCVRTGTGLHLYFAHPGTTVRNDANVHEGLDVRGDGGYVVAPPSIHANGNAYEVINSNAPQPMPDWLVQLVAEREPTAMTVRRAQVATTSAVLLPTDIFPLEDASLRIYAEGERNNGLATAAGKLRWAGLAVESIEVLLILVNERYCYPPLPITEVSRITASIAKYPAVKDTSPMHWFKHDVDRWHDTKIRLLSDYQRGWYISLRTAAWRSGGVLPSDIHRLAVLADATDRQQFREECAPVLDLFRTVALPDGRVLLLDEELADYFIHAVFGSKAKSRGGQQSGAVRREKARTRRTTRRVRSQAVRDNDTSIP